MARRTSRTLRRVFQWSVGILLGVGLTQTPRLAAWASQYLTAESAALIAAATVAQTVIILVSVIVAFLAYLASMRTTARQNTLDRIFQEHIDEDVLKQRRIYIAIRDDKADKLSSYANNEHRDAFIRAQTKQEVVETERATPELAERIRDARDLFDSRRSAIIAVLNRYETFAIGIDENALDEEMYKRWWRTSLIRDWYSLKDTIDVIRKAGPSAYVEFQALAQKWETEMVREDGTIPRPKRRS